MKKGFKMKRKLFCETCRSLTLHHIELIDDAPKDERVHALRACLDCLEGHEKLKGIGIETPHPVLYQPFFVQPYVYLVLHPGYSDP